MFLEVQTTNINVTDLIEVSNNQTIQMIVLFWYFSSLIHVISLYYKSMTHALWTWYALREFYTSNPLSKLSKGQPVSMPFGAYDHTSSVGTFWTTKSLSL
jgi:hypothetical protein